MRARLITPPEPAITLAQAKDHLRVTHSEDDAAILEIVQEATAKVEADCDRAFGAQTWELRLDTFPRWIDLRPVPLVSVTSLTYRDAGDVEQTIQPTAYSTGYLTRGDAYLYPVGDWPTASGNIVVRYVVGDGWPLDVRRAVKLLVSHWYDNRGVMRDGQGGEMPFAVTALLERHRRMFA